MVDWFKLEGLAYEHQEECIKARFGTAKSANYGWGVDEQPDCTVISTKVYSDPVMILTTTVMADGSMMDDWMVY